MLETDPVEVELKEKKKDLVVIALTDHTPHGDAAIHHAVLMCMIFKAELCILPLNPEPKQFSDNFLQALQKARENQVNVTHHTYEKNLKRKIGRFAEEINAMMLVISIGKNSHESYFTPWRAMRWILPSRLPVLAVGRKNPAPHACQQVILPMDSSVFAKEKALWAGYFYRFYNSGIHILYKEYKDSYLAEKVNANLQFTDKIYGNLEIQSQKHQIEERWEEIDLYALQFAPEVKASLIVSMTTKYPTVGDLLFGRKERKIFRHLDDIPYLLINQRDDLYVLCT